AAVADPEATDHAIGHHDSGVTRTPVTERTDVEPAAPAPARVDSGGEGPEGLSPPQGPYSYVVGSRPVVERVIEPHRRCVEVWPVLVVPGIEGPCVPVHV